MLSALLEEGYTTLLPLGEHRYDLVIERGGLFYRVQVKTGRLKNGCVIFNAYSTNGSTGVRTLYTADQIDFYGVYCHEVRQCYLVPVGHVGVEGKLRIDPPKNNQKSGVRMAEIYKIPSL